MLIEIVTVVNEYFVFFKNFIGKIDFVFVCHDPKPLRPVRESSTISRSRSALPDSFTSDDDDDVSEIDDRKKNLFFNH